MCSGQSNMEFNMFGIFDAENEMDLSAAYTEVFILVSFCMNFMQVKFTKVNKVTAGQEMEDLWGGQSIPWSRCKCHYLMKKHCSTSLQPTKPSNAEHVFCSLLLIRQNTI